MTDFKIAVAEKEGKIFYSFFTEMTNFVKLAVNFAKKYIYSKQHKSDVYHPIVFKFGVVVQFEMLNNGKVNAK